MEASREACTVCGGEEFYIEVGSYFCMECHTQKQDRREAYAEVRIDPTTRIRKIRMKKQKKATEKKELTGWTSWEKYNFILLGLTSQLITLGASPDIKLTVLQLWATYLGKIEVAFMSTRGDKLPRLPLHFNKRDSELVYGVSKRGRKRKRGGSSSIITSKTGGSSSVSSASSFTSGASSTRQINKQKRAVIASEYSETDTDAMSGVTDIRSMVSTASQSKKNHLSRHFNKFAKAKRKKLNAKIKKLPSKGAKTKMIDKIQGKAQNLKDPDHLSLSTLWGILYIALRIHESEFHMADLLRAQKEGKLSHYRLDDLFPPDVEEIDRKVPNNMELTQGLIAETSKKLIKFLNVSQIPSPNLNTLIKRYCTELQLPSGVALYAERVLASNPPVFTVKQKSQFCQIPNYEAKAMAIILMVMKILFGLDGVTEIEMSRVTDKINTLTDDPEMRLFNFSEWQRYIECRKTVIMSEHYPTKFKYDPKSPTDSSKLYLNYLKHIHPIAEEQNKNEASLSTIILETTKKLKNEIERLIENSPPLEKVRRFEFSFTPLHSYLEELKQDHQKDIPPILQKDMTSTKIGYITDPDLFKEVAEQCGIDLKIIDSSGNFVEKIVPTFDGAAGILTSCPEIFNEQVPVVITSALDKDDSKIKKKNNDDDYLSYFHRKNPGKIRIDEKKKKIYEKICKNNSRPVMKKSVKKNGTQDYGFGLVLPSGKLYVPDDNSDSDDPDDEVDVTGDSRKVTNILLSRYERENPCKRPDKSEKTKSPSSTSRNCSCVICRDYPDETVESSDELKDKNDENSSDSDPDISILSETLNTEKQQSKSLITYRPFKDYWLRRVGDWKQLKKPQFSEIKSNLPINYRWLLSECSKIIENEEQSLYHEVCRVESYFADVVCQDYSECRAKKFFEATNYRSNQIKSLTKKRWLN